MNKEEGGRAKEIATRSGRTSSIAQLIMQIERQLQNMRKVL